MTRCDYAAALARAHHHGRPTRKRLARRITVAGFFEFPLPAAALGHEDGAVIAVLDRRRLLNAPIQARGPCDSVFLNIPRANSALTHRDREKTLLIRR